jgi:Spx/MgsR family transcriptional regulator
MKLYQYGKCSTCKKAIKFLKEKDQEFKEIDITQTPPSKAELKKMLAFYDGNLKRLFNTSGVQYREQKVADKLKTMSEADAIDMLSKNGKLVKRPFVISKEYGLVGFKENEWGEVF